MAITDSAEYLYNLWFSIENEAFERFKDMPLEEFTPYEQCIESILDALTEYIVAVKQGKDKQWH